MFIFESGKLQKNRRGWSRIFFGKQTILPDQL